MIFLGIDPGLKGGLAALKGPGESGPTASFCPMPVSGGEVDARAIGIWLWDFALKNDNQVVVCVEKVGAMPKQGVVSTFTFGVGYGKILGAAGALGMRAELVTPQAWKKVVLAGTTKDKDAAVAYCMRAWPGLSLVLPGCRVPHDGCADALCIAEFARRTYK